MAILLFRPLKKLASSVENFCLQGLNTVGTALIDTVEIPSAAQSFFQKVEADNKPAVCVFVSTSAANILGKACLAWPKHLSVIAVGASTQIALRKWGIEANIPTQHDTEGLLTMNALTDCARKDIYLIKGLGGRQKLANELVKRQARVHEINLYERQKLVRPFSTKQWRQTEIKCIIATSGEQLEAAFEQFDHHWLKTTRWIVVSSRIKEIALERGVQHIDVSPGANDDTLIRFIKELEQ